MADIDEEVIETTGRIVDAINDHQEAYHHGLLEDHPTNTPVLDTSFEKHLETGEKLGISTLAFEFNDPETKEKALAILTPHQVEAHNLQSGQQKSATVRVRRRTNEEVFYVSSFDGPA